MLDSNLNDGTYWRAMELIPNGFGSNERCRIHQQYMLEVPLKFGGTGSKGWSVGCNQRLVRWVQKGPVLLVTWVNRSRDLGNHGCGSHFEQPQIHQLTSYGHGSGTRMISTLNCIKYFLT